MKKYGGDICMYFVLGQLVAMITLSLAQVEMTPFILVASGVVFSGIKIVVNIPGTVGKEMRIQMIDWRGMLAVAMVAGSTLFIFTGWNLAAFYIGLLVSAGLFVVVFRILRPQINKISENLIRTKNFEEM